MSYYSELVTRDIQHGEELTDDNRGLNIIESFWAADKGHELKCVYLGDLLKYHKVWVEQIKIVFDRIPALNPAALFVYDG